MAIELFEVVFNGEGFDASASLISARAVIHTPCVEFNGPEGLQDHLGIVPLAHPDASYDIASIDVQRDTVVVRWNMTATSYWIDPTDPVLKVLVRRSGVTTLTVADSQVADLSQTHSETAITSPIEVARNYGSTE